MVMATTFFTICNGIAKYCEALNSIKRILDTDICKRDIICQETSIQAQPDLEMSKTIQLCLNCFAYFVMQHPWVHHC